MAKEKKKPESQTDFRVSFVCAVGDVHIFAEWLLTGY